MKYLLGQVIWKSTKRLMKVSYSRSNLLKRKKKLESHPSRIMLMMTPLLTCSLIILMVIKRKRPRQNQIQNLKMLLCLMKYSGSSNGSLRMMSYTDLMTVRRCWTGKSQDISMLEFWLEKLGLRSFGIQKELTLNYIYEIE